MAYNGTASNSAGIHVVTNSFGAFTAGATGSGPASLQNFNSATDVPLNTLLRSAVPGQTAILYGTGLGPVAGNEAAGALPGNLTTDVQIFVGANSAAVSYAGRAGCCAGLDQINFTVPQGVEGCFVPVAVRTGGVISNFTTMSIAGSGQICSDPLSFSVVRSDSDLAGRVSSDRSDRAHTDGCGRGHHGFFHGDVWQEYVGGSSHDSCGSVTRDLPGEHNPGARKCPGTDESSGCGSGSEFQRYGGIESGDPFEHG